MTSVDSRIVTMKFDNAAFSKGVADTISMLGKLTSAVSGLSAIKAGANLAGIGKSFDLAPAQNQVAGLASSFSTLGVIAVSALATIASKATSMALDLGKSFTFGPILAGLSEYQLNLQSIQTIQANTDQPLTKINASLEELNRYSDRTIYNFAEMAKNIGTFTAAGVDLKTATSSIKGIANLAALSGSTSGQAATAMYQLSQALASGKVSLMDWNSVVNAGMGGKKFQTQIANTAVAMGAIGDESVDLGGKLGTLKINGMSFRESLSADAGGNPWFTSEVLKTSLATLDGRFSRMALSTEKMADGTLKYKNAAEVTNVIDRERNKLAQQGTVYTDAQWKSLLQLSDSSFLAATQVKTLSQVFDVAKETMGSGWAATFKNIFGDFGEAKKTFTELSGFINDGINAMALARNKVLSNWNEAGGRMIAIEGIKNAFQALFNILKPIGQAWRDVFPATTANRLKGLTIMFWRFTEGLIASEGTMENIRSIFGAIFGVLGVGIEIIQGVLKYFFSFFGLLSGGAGGLLDFSGSIAEVVAQLTQWILKGDYIAKFFDNLIAGRAALLGPIIEKFGELLSYLAGIVAVGADFAFDRIVDAAKALAPVLEDVSNWAQSTGEMVRSELIAGFEKLKPVLDKVREAITDTLSSLSGVGSSAGGALGGLAGLFSIDGATDAAATGIDKVKEALAQAGPAASAAKGELEGFPGFLAGLGGALATFGKFIYKIFVQIKDDMVDTFSSLSDNAGGVLGSIKDFVGNIFSAIGEFFGNISFAEVMAGLSVALGTLLTGSVARILFQLGGIFKDFRGVMNSMSGMFDGITDGIKTFQTGVRAEAIKDIAVALLLLAVALYILSKIPADKLATGMVAVSVMLGVLVTAIKILEKSIPDASSLKDAAQLGAMAVVIVALAAAMLLMAAAVFLFSLMSPEELQKGLTSVAIVLASITAATFALNKSGGATSILAASVAVLVLAVALVALAGAIKLYSALDTGMLVEGGAKIAILLLTLGIAFRAMPTAGALTGAAAIFIMANALVIMAGALKLMATMSGGDSFQSIFTMAAALLVLSIAANSMTGALMGAAAMVVMAAAIALLVPSLLLLGNADISTIVIGITALAAALLVIGLVAYALTATGAVIAIAALGVAILVLGAGLALIGGALVLFATGLTILAAVGSAAVVILIEVINTFLEALPGFIMKFGDSLIAAAKVIETSAPAFIKAGGAILSALLQVVLNNIPKIGRVFRALLNEGIKTIGDFVPKMIRTGLRILLAFLDGIGDNIYRIVSKAVKIVTEFLRALGDKADDIAQGAARMIIKFMNALAQAIEDNSEGFGRAGGRIVVAIVKGIGSAITGYVSEVAGAIRNMVSSAISQVDVGGMISSVVGGVGKRAANKSSPGIDKTEVAPKVNGVVPTEELPFNNVQKAIQGMLDKVPLDMTANPVIKPVLDLSQFEMEARQMRTMVDGRPVIGATSYGQASEIAAAQVAALEAAYARDSASSEITFVQNNNSPKALSASEVYRQTKNQLSLAKEALNA